MRKFFIAILFVSIFLPQLSLAQEEGSFQYTEIILKAKVVEVISETEENIRGGPKANFQTLAVEIIEGENKGKIVELENDYLNFKEGEKLFLRETTSGEDGSIVYSIYDKYRLPAIYFFAALFLVLIFIFGGIQGVRGLASLIGSMILISFVLIPGILNGYSPILVTIGVSLLIIILGSYITHGFNKTTTSAVIGMVVTVIFTGSLAYFAVNWAGLSGFDSEEAVYLNWNTGGSIDLVGLLFGAIMIGLLGVLYDAAIGQAIAVEELKSAGSHLKRKDILKRALRMGREHIGALVDTLAIAYVGASLPLLLLFYGSEMGTFNQILNREVFSTEIVRILIGSIGLVLAVPITTFVAVLMLVRPESESEIKSG